MAKKRTLPPPKLLTRQQLAAQFHTTPGTITRWERDGMPVAQRLTRGKHSLFSLDAARTWKAAQDRAPAGASTFALSASRAKLADKQSEKLDLEIAKARGDVMLVDQVVRECQTFGKGLTAKLRSLPRQLEQLGVVTTEHLPIVEDKIRDILTEFSRWKWAAAAKKRTRA